MDIKKLLIRVSVSQELFLFFHCNAVFSKVFCVLKKGITMAYLRLGWMVYSVTNTAVAPSAALQVHCNL